MITVPPLFWFQLAEVFEATIDTVMQLLGYCCGHRYVFCPQVLCCYGKQLCTIARDTMYYSYQNRWEWIAAMLSLHTYTSFAAWVCLRLCVCSHTREQVLVVVLMWWRFQCIGPSVYRMVPCFSWFVLVSWQRLCVVMVLVSGLAPLGCDNRRDSVSVEPCVCHLCAVTLYRGLTVIITGTHRLHLLHTSTCSIVAVLDNITLSPSLAPVPL